MLLLVLLLVVVYDSNAQEIEKINPKTRWTDMFKEFVTFKCICEITKDGIDSLMYRNKDYSFVVHAELLSGRGAVADSIGRDFARKIPYITTEKESDLYGWKGSLYDCLKFLTSPQLDSIANKQYLIFMKTHSADWLERNQ